MKIIVLGLTMIMGFDITSLESAHDVILKEV